MTNSTMKSIENYINNEFANAKPIDYMTIVPRSFHSFYGGYTSEYHIEQDDYSQETYDLVANSYLTDMLNDLYCEYIFELTDAIRTNPTFAKDECGLDHEDEMDMEYMNDEDFNPDEDGCDYIVFTNYFISLVHEAMQNAEIEERCELLKSFGFEITDNSTIEIDATYSSDNLNIDIQLYEDWDFSVEATDDDYEDIDYEGYMNYETSEWIYTPFMKELRDAPMRYSKEAFIKWLPQMIAFCKQEASKVAA